MERIPTILREAALPQVCFQLVEWHWPEVIDFRLRESELMLEMSLPPYQTDATAELTDLDAGTLSLMGSLFIRYPGVEIRGRGGGGRIRVLRCTFSPALRRSLAMPSPRRETVPLIRSLLIIRDEPIRCLMRLAHRELEELDSSHDALGALANLLLIALRRLLHRSSHSQASGRLADWQYRRIREQLASPGPLPTTAELAAICGISVRHLDRQFLALTGSTVAAYIDAFWIDRAKAMLSHGEAPIKAIAFACGFAHTNSFARAFRRATGASPSCFRQASHIS